MKRKIKDFSIINQCVFFIDCDMVAEKYCLGMRNIFGKIKTIDFVEPLHTLNLDTTQVSVGVLGEKNQYFYSHDLDFINISELGLRNKFENMHLGTIQVNEKSVLALYDSKSKKILWNLDFYSGMTFINSSYLICLKGGNRSVSNVIAYPLNSGKAKWEYKIESKKKFGYAKFLVELCGNLFFYFNHDESIYAVNIENGQLVNKWKFASQPIFYENKIGCLGEKHEELDLKTMKFTTTDMRAEYEKQIKPPRWIESHNYIAHGLGFVTFLRGLKNGEPEELILVAVDISTHKVVWQHKLVNDNWKQLEYDGERIYLLGHKGILTIFEREN